MVEVFKTNVRNKTQSKILLCVLSEAFPAVAINFDLADCDKVLRVEGAEIKNLSIISMIKAHGFTCDVL